MAKVTQHIADVTFLPSAVSTFPHIYGRQQESSGHLLRIGRRQSWRKGLSALCPAPAECTCACHRLLSSVLLLSPLGKQKHCSVCRLDLPLVSACLFKFPGRDMLSQRAGKSVWGPPPEGVSLSLWALAGNVSEEALIPFPA